MVAWIVASSLLIAVSCRCRKVHEGAARGPRCRGTGPRRERPPASS